MIAITESVMASLLFALLTMVARLWRVACRLGRRIGAPIDSGSAVVIHRAYVSDHDAWFDVTERFRDWWAAAAARDEWGEATGYDLACEWGVSNRLSAETRTAGLPPGSLSVSFRRGAESFLVTYPLSCRISFPPWKDEEETETVRPPVDARTRLSRKVLSATFGRSRPHAEDEDCTRCVARSLGPLGDFYASAGLPQFVWALWRHAEIEKSSRRALRALGRRPRRGRLSAPSPWEDRDVSEGEGEGGGGGEVEGEADVEKGGDSSDPPCFLRVIFGDGKTVVYDSRSVTESLGSGGTAHYTFDAAAAKKRD
eukprot:jgi/Mesvir1/10211/Mv08531-RA.1